MRPVTPTATRIPQVRGLKHDVRTHTLYTVPRSLAKNTIWRQPRCRCKLLMALPNEPCRTWKFADNVQTIPIDCPTGYASTCTAARQLQRELTWSLPKSSTPRLGAQTAYRAHNCYGYLLLISQDTYRALILYEIHGKAFANHPRLFVKNQKRKRTDYAVSRT